MTHLHSGTWHWHFRDPADREALGCTPEKRPEGARVVKSSAIREVFTTGRYFIKIDRLRRENLIGNLKKIFFPKCRSEFQTLTDLRAAGIPAVEPVAWGKCGPLSGLITRAMPDTVSAAEFFHTAVGREGRQCPEFFRNWCRFVRTMLDSGFHHPDFHNGNLLYRESDHAFALVDVYGVKPSRHPNRRRMAMILREFAEFLTAKELLGLISECGIPEPEDFYEAMFRCGAAMIRHEWPRREKQFLSGYAKFVRAEGDLNRTTDGAGRLLDLENTEKHVFSPEDAEKLCREDFRLRLLNLPRCRVAAWKSSGTIWLEKSSGPASKEGMTDLVRRLKLGSLDPERYDFGRDKFGRDVIRMKLPVPEKNNL